jgi:ankyrin repeat protein
LKVDINEPYEDGNFPLWTSIRDDRKEIFQYLIAHGANVNYRSSDNREPPLWHALTRPYYLIPLLQAGANPHQPPGILEWAVWRGHMENIRVLVEQAKVPVDEAYENGNFPLWTAIRDDRKEIFQYLISKGANVHNRSTDNREPLLWHALTRPEYMRPLLRAGANAHDPPGILEWAVWRDRMESVRILVEEARVDPNVAYSNNNWPLWTAIRDNRVEIFNYLLNHGADPNHHPNDREPLLVYAVTRGNCADFMQPLAAHGCLASKNPGVLVKAIEHDNNTAVALLLDLFKVDVNERRNGEETPLTTAIRRNLSEQIQLLLQRGANPNLEGDGIPLLLAADRRNVAAVQALLKAGANPNAVAENGTSALHEVCSNGNKEIAKLLLDSGANPELPDKSGTSPMEIAANRGHEDIVMMILEKMG